MIANNLSVGLVLLAASLVCTAQASSPIWSGVAYPSTDYDKHKVITSNRITYSTGASASISYTTLYRTSQTFGDAKAGRLIDKNGAVIYKMAADGTKLSQEEISQNPDFTSTIQFAGKIYSVTHFESPGPAAAYISELLQDAETGTLSVQSTKPLSFSLANGLWIPCAGSVTPWNTHLGSEEYEPNARPLDAVANINLGFNSSALSSQLAVVPYMRYFGIYTSAGDLTPAIMRAGGFYPYSYGYAWEVKIDATGVATAVKHYAMGRQSYELAYVMPDNKTVYGTDDGTNVMFTKFVMTTAGDLSSGINYCARVTQTSAAGSDAKDFEADVEWVKMFDTVNDDEVKARIMTIKFQDIFNTTSPVGISCPDGYQSVNVGGYGLECLQLLPGQEKWASVFEKRRYAGYLGCTTEFRKWEGLTFDPQGMMVYTALTEVSNGMEDFKSKGIASNSSDAGIPNHLKVQYNKCGCVLKLSVNSTYSISSIAALTCGTMGSYNNGSDTCSPDGIASPDNVAFIPEFNQLLIGEDTSYHENNLLWVYDIASSNMTRLASTPYGAETTSAYWPKTIGGFNYLTFVVQHPYDDVDPVKITAPDSTGPDGWVGYIGPFRLSTVSASSTSAPSNSSASSTSAPSNSSASSTSAPSNSTRNDVSSAPSITGSTSIVLTVSLAFFGW